MGMRSRDLARRLALVAVLVGSTFLGACTSDSGSSNNRGNTNFVLSFTAEPNNSITGGTLAPVAVTLADPFGNVLTTTNTPVTISLENASNASLAGTLTVTPVNGVATFSDLVITGVGTDFNLRASAQGFDSVLSVAFTISNGAPSQLGFLQGPSDTDLGSLITPIIQVAVQDAVGATISSSTSTVTLSLANNPGNATLNGTLSVAAVNGVAEFTDISIDTVGTGYTLLASTAGLNSATSVAFDINPGPIAALNIQTQPSDSTENLAVNPSIEVALVDAGNNVVTSGAAPITLTLGTNTGRARLLGTTTVIANNGVATFNDIRLSEEGTGYALIASTAIIQTAVTTNGFNINRDDPDVVNLSVPNGDLSGCVPITYSVAQAASEKVDILVEYDPDGTGTFFRATQASMTGTTSQGIAGVASAPGPNGGGGVFLWDSARDLPLASLASAQIRVTASLRGNAGSSMTLSNLSIQNNARLSSGAVISTATGPQAVAIADMNKDGLNDLVIADDAASNVAVYLQDAANPGSFLSPVNVAVGANPRSVAVGDFNKDGRLDIAVANFGDDTIAVRLQNSGASLSFASSADLTADTNPRFVIADDFNKDGVLDLAVANEGSVLTLHFGIPATPGTFAAAVQFDADSAPVALASGDINQDGFPDLLVANRDSDNVSVLLHNSGAPSTFLASTEFTVGTAPSSVALADVNQDGLLDIVATNAGSDNLSVLLQDSSNPGSFLAAQNTALGASPSSLVSGDFNRDGRPDFAVTEQTAGTVSLILADHQNPGQVLAPIPTTLSAGLVALASGDINRDGLLDLVAVNATANSATVLNNIQAADCGFRIGGSVAFPVGANPNGVVTADVNNDGRPDLVVVNNSDQTLSLLFGSGDGAFSSSGLLSTGNGPGSIAKADLNGDGQDDFVVANVTSNTVTVLNQTGPGQYQSGATISTNSLGSVAAGFVDSDGRQDLAFTNPADDTASLLLQDPSNPGAFLAPITVNTGGNPGALALADLNNDLHGDLAVANVNSSSVTVFIQDENNPMSFLDTTLAVGTTPSAVRLADFNGDNFLDLIVTNQGDNTVTVYPHDSANPGSFLAPLTLSVGSEPVGVEVFDINSDGFADIVTVNQGNNSLSILTQDSANPGSFLGAQTLILSGLSVALSSGDFDGDGRSDLAVVLQDCNHVQVLRQGPSGFTTATRVSVGGNPGDLTVGDFNLDGRPDFASVQGNANNFSVSLQNAQGDFAVPTDVTSPSATRIRRADFNNDGRLDLLIVSSSESTARVAVDDPQTPGTFTSSAPINLGSAPSDIVIADFNGDGRLDFASSDSGANTVTVILQSAATRGTFDAPVTLSVGNSPSALTAADINCDGVIDLVVANTADDNLSLLLGDSANPGAFLAASTLSTGSAPVALAALDVNRDGQVDIVTGLGGGTVSISLQDPANLGSFLAPSTVAVTGSITDIEAGDLNRDGFVDLAISNGQGTVVLIQDASNPGTLTVAGVLNSGRQTNAVVVQDVNRDGRLDVLVADGLSSQVSVFNGR